MVFIVASHLTTVIWTSVGAFVGFGFSALLYRSGFFSRRGQARQDRIGSILLDSETPEFIWRRYDGRGQLLVVSPGIKALLGVDAAAFVSGEASIEAYVHPADRPLLERAADARAIGGVEPLQYQFRIRREDGRWHWMHERQVAFVGRKNKATGYETLALDFSDRVRFEQQQQRMIHLQRLLSGVLSSIVESEDLLGDLADTLDRVVQYLGLSSATILAVDEELQHTEPAVSVVRDSSVGGPGVPLHGDAATWWLRRITGGLPMMIERRNLTDIEPRLRGAFAQAVTGSALVMPLLVEGDLKYVFVLEAPESNRKWEAEEQSILQTIAHAISRRLEQDETQRERDSFAELRSNIERSEAVAHFVSGIIHDFNNLMFAVTGRLSLLVRRVKDEPTRLGLEEVRGAVSDAGGVLRRLLQAERLGMDEAIRFDPLIEMAQIIRTAQRLLPKRIRFEADLRPIALSSPHLIEAVPQTLQQLVLNLVVNARDAVGSDGRIRIIAGPSDDTKFFQVQIEDDGPGIPEAMRQEVLKAFVSTKESGRGTGLGLSICNRVVIAAGGTLELGDSTLGGLLVTARFPLMVGEVEEDEERPVSEVSISSVILVIEDNSAIRDVLSRELELAGATVIALPDAINAEAVIKASEERIGLYIFDIDLPERTGVECLADLRSAGDQIPCLFITGGTSEPPALAKTELLRKPFRTATLLESCLRLLSS